MEKFVRDMKSFGALARNDMHLMRLLGVGRGRQPKYFIYTLNLIV